MSQNALSIKKGITMKGRYTFTLADMVTPEDFARGERIAKLRDEIYNLEIKKTLARPESEKRRLQSAIEHYRATMTREIGIHHTLCKTTKIVKDNIIPTVARTMIANNLTAVSPTNVMKITHCALGSSGTTPANADTQLGTETYRNSIASLTNSLNVAYATGFFSATEVTGTFAECGIFSNGTGSANSGILFSHVLISLTKTNTQTLTLDWTLTIS